MGAVRRSSCRAITTQLDLYRAITTQLGLYRAIAKQLGLYRTITKQLGIYRAITIHHTTRSVARSPHRSVCRAITTPLGLSRDHHTVQTNIRWSSFACLSRTR